MKHARLLRVLAFAAATELPAADFYVSPKGDDTNPGTGVERPFLTLQRADSAVRPGDTVWIMAGTYRNTAREEGGGTSSLLTLNTSGTPDAWITWRNYRNDKPELIAQGCWNAINLRASYLVIDGLTVTGNNDQVRQLDAELNAEIDAIKTADAFAAAQDAAKKTIDESVAPDAKVSSKDMARSVPAPRPKPVQANVPDPFYNGNGIGVDCRTGPKFHHFTIRNCTVRKFGTVGISMIATDYYTIENCEVYENAWYSRYGGSGISQLLGTNFDDAPGYHNVIRGNRVWNNKCLVRCLNTDCFSDGNGIILDSLRDYSGAVLVENNLCFNNGGAGIHAFKAAKAQIDVIGNTLWRNQQMWQLYEMGAHTVNSARFLNNIVVGERGHLVTSEKAAGVTFDYNIYFGSYKAAVVGAHDLLADPKFVLPSTNPKVADFHLKPDSPAIDSGTDAAVARTDLDGASRVQGPAPDRGAYESPVTK